ncbi:MFS transporter [Lentzea sp. HUAS12]|uniref:MFS transporter n=1 Tax=Lentzea sp. HUAS12 TaxID=2951806 RepID=UPI0020A0C28A|nr:MFS transporter [Lentzea sp. HUAS12]USX52856.1 MFS transporter [Lentzea sp. HUAS12]
MSRAQVQAVALCLVMNVVDGFDLLVTSFVGPAITREWGLSPSSVGVLLSGGLAGMAIGALFLAPLADRIGRRKITLGSLALASLGMLAAAFTQDLGQLLAARVVTGVAVGTMAASLPVLTSEYSNNKRKGTAVALITTGYGIGAVIAGLSTSVLVGSTGWRSVFVFGAVATAVLFLVGLKFLPESMDYLVAKRPAGALPRFNKILVSMGRQPVDELPAHDTGSRKVALESLFQGGNAVRTVLVWLAFTAAQTAFYFASSWTPTLLLKAGMSNQQGISGGILFSLGGITGAALLGVLVSKVEARKLTAAYFGLAAVMLVLFSLSLGTLAIALVFAVVLGLFLNGTISGINVIVPLIYPAESRATALGMAVAVSRLGAVLAPLFAGYLVQAGWQPSSMYQVFTIPALIGGAAVLLLTRFGRSTPNAVDAPVKAGAVAEA